MRWQHRRTCRRRLGPAPARLRSSPAAHPPACWCTKEVVTRVLEHLSMHPCAPCLLHSGMCAGLGQACLRRLAALLAPPSLQTKRLWQRIPADLLPREVEVQTCGGAWRGAAHLEEDHHEEFEECRCRRVEPRLQIKAATAEFGSGRINFVHARRCREASIFLLWGSTGACGFSADLTHQQYTSAPWFHVQICNNCNTASLEGPK